ncbi:MAG: carbamoyltransferase HypF [bacterium]|nr:MAG: carbamoyltransferase HypF [bacterium]
MKPTKSRYRIEVDGIVQGVGFRPFVYRLALDLGLTGWVTNTSDGVLIEVEGTPAALAAFTGRLRGDAPPLASIASVKEQTLPPTGYLDFTIRSSLARADRRVLVSPDTAICVDCRRELLDPGDRRYRYPFINCTNCGPRYTIIRSVPYDRPNTSMASFTMCPACRSEYEDPADRRFHAQPNACFACGPRLGLVLSDGGKPDGDALEAAFGLLREGRIVAIKGLGGYHLAVDPADDGAVTRLRARKGREEKPLALMVRGIPEAGKLCRIDDSSRALLESTEGPIVLLRRLAHPDPALSPGVAPRSRYFGLMLPYTPLHVLFMEEFPMLVMTSANISEEPLCSGDEEVRTRLDGIADAFLMHDREITLRCDDSIVRPDADCPERGPIVLRRARGFVPAPVPLNRPGAEVLALGPELKGTVCLTKGDKAFIGQHLGDLKNLETVDFLREVVLHLADILQITPEALACDLHPDYLTTWLAEEGAGDTPWPKDIPVYRVQHHHAHVLSCQAEAGLDGPVVGLALDGTGYGTDATIWGGEILLVDGTRMERLGHLRTVWMPGGERAIEEPYRMTLSYLLEAQGEAEAAGTAGSLFPDLDPERLQLLLGLAAGRTHGIMTSSCGRLFDAFSALAGVCLHTRYEGQPAIELEMLTDASVADILPYSLDRGDDGTVIVDLVPSFATAVERRLAGDGAGVLGGLFHRTLAAALTDAVSACLEDHPGLPRRIPLGGGVFQNETLSAMLAEEFAARSLEPVFHRLVPTNDGGISLGQAVYGRMALEMTKG